MRKSLTEKVIITKQKAGSGFDGENGYTYDE